VKSQLPIETPKSRFWVEVSKCGDVFTSRLYEEGQTEDWIAAKGMDREQTVKRCTRDLQPGLTVAVFDLPIRGTNAG
jgi:hypothetical protein